LRPRLEVRDLTVVGPAGGRPVLLLRSLSFVVEPGEILGLIGESGCGKSLTLLSVLGLLPRGLAVQAGSVRLDGMELIGAPQRAMAAIRGRRVAIIFQDPQNCLNPSFTIGRQVGEALCIHKLARGRRAVRDRVVELLTEVGLPDPEGCMDRFPHQLSGGMQQRALIATALAAGPQLLLADEPTTALDVSVQAQIMELLRDVNRQRGCSIVLVTHDLALASQFCDRIAVMYAGQIVEEGSVANIVHRPAHPYTQGLLACLPMLGRRQQLRPIPGEIPTPDEVLAVGCAFAPRCRHRLQECTSAHIELHEATDGHRARCLLVRHSPQPVGPPT
jgi:peptide/nickel transport system ATP-binding protein